MFCPCLLPSSLPVMAVGIGSCSLAAGGSCWCFPCPIPKPGLPVVGCKLLPGKASFSSEVLDPALTASSPLCRVVKEEISDDNAKLPCFNGRVVSWVSKRLASVSCCLFLPSLKTTIWLHSAN